MDDREPPFDGRREPSPRDVEVRDERKEFNRWLIVAIVAAVMAGILLASSVWDRSWQSENSVGNEMVAADAPAAEKWCAAQTTYDSIRRELFRRAAQVRGGDQQAYTRLADFALLRMNNPIVRGVDEQLSRVACSGTAFLDLPPGVTAAGFRRSLSADIDYTVQPAADGTGNVVRLGNADGIVVPLATLSRSGAPQTAPLFPPDLENRQPPEQPSVDVMPELIPEPRQPVEEPPAPEPRESFTNPSFDCRNARTSSEKAVCQDPGLAALDRRMAAQFNSAMSRGNSEQRALLRRTRDRFLGYRDRCADNGCIANTYRSRMREISDIMANRWRG